MYKEEKEVVKPCEYIEINVESPDGPKIVKIDKELRMKKGERLKNWLENTKIPSFGYMTFWKVLSS